MVKLKWLKSYCTIIYGVELWPLDSANIETFCAAWREALRRRIYYNNHATPILTFFIFWVTLYPSMMEFASVR